MLVIGVVPHLLFVLFLLSSTIQAWSTPKVPVARPTSPLHAQPGSILDNLSSFFNGVTGPSSRVCKARELIKSLVEEEKCFSMDRGASVFGEACASNVIYEDCFEPKPFIGKDVRLLFLG